LQFKKNVIYMIYTQKYLKIENVKKEIHKSAGR
jgi:hypothetical protein